MADPAGACLYALGWGAVIAAALTVLVTLAHNWAVRAREPKPDPFTIDRLL